MDNLTHTLVGVALGQAGPGRRFGAGTTAVLAIASNLPDVDAVLALTGPWDYFIMRRTFTHSIVGVPLLAALAALIERRVWPDLRYRTLFWLNLLGMAVHVLFDLLNSYGVRPLYPFDDTRYELAWVFIIDLMLIGILALPLAAWRRPPATRERCARLALAGVALYVALCGAGRAYARALLAGPAAGASFSYVFPEALGNHRFRGAVRRGPEWTLYQIRLAEGAVVPAATFRTHADEPPVTRIRQLPDARRLETFFRAPVWEPAGGGCWTAFDLRFVSTVFPWRQRPFAFVFDEEGRRPR